MLEIPDALCAPGRADPSPAALDPLTKRIVQLVTLHHVPLAFQDHELRHMDEASKRKLIADVEWAIDLRRAPVSRTP